MRGRKISTKKISSLDGFHWRLLPAFKKEIILILDKFFYRVKEEETIPKLFYHVSIAMTSKPYKGITKKKIIIIINRPIYLINIGTTILKYILVKLIFKYVKKIIY